MRYYLDTNIVAFILFDKNLKENCDEIVRNLLSNYENNFLISTIVVRELLRLYNDGELKSIKYKSQKQLLSHINELSYEIKPFTKENVICYGNLDLRDDHKDPNDHMIISQAISEKIPLISSDKKFRHYEKQGLKFIFNKR